MKRVVIGLGNPLRADDGIGVLLIQRLKQDKEEHGSKTLERFDLIDGGTGGMNLLHILEDYEEVILMDTVYFDGEPGDHVFFTPEEVRSLDSPKSSHDSNVLQVLELSEEVGKRPEKVLIMGIQPEKVGFEEDLSESLEENIPKFLRALKKKMKGF